MNKKVEKENFQELKPFVTYLSFPFENFTPYICQLKLFAMRKRKTYGYILLTMLIVSGLAGTPTNNSLSKKERKFVTDHMKSTKAELINSFKGWSEAQLNYRSAPDKWSASDYVYHLAAAENGLWQLLETTLKESPNPEKRSEIRLTDDQLTNSIQDWSFKTKRSFVTENTPYKSLEDALSDFKEKRADHIKYLKNTTEDMRNHITETPLGWLDCYQISLLISSHSNRLTLLINELKSENSFPK